LKLRLCIGDRNFAATFIIAIKLGVILKNILTMAALCPRVMGI